MSATMTSTPEIMVLPMGSPTIADTSRHEENKSRWRDLREFSFFLSDGVLRTIGLVPCPFIKSDALTARSSFTDIDIENLKNSTSKTTELQERLLKLCSTSPSQLRNYHNYHYKLFRNMWLWKYQNAIKEASSAETSMRHRQSNALEETPTVLMGSKLSLLLLVPLLKSQATMDKGVAAETAKLLLSMLLELPGLSLSSAEFQAPLDQLEILFEQWIKEQGHEFEELGFSVMIALCCARGSLTSILKTVILLEEREDKDTLLPVRKILESLSSLETRIGKPCKISRSRHLKCFGYDDQLEPMGAQKLGHTLSAPNSNENESNQSPIPDPVANWHGLATDGIYLYVSGSRGKGLSKIGTGFNGSLQGYVYNENSELHTDFIAYGNGILVGRLTCPFTSSEPEETWDENTVPFGAVIDESTLTVMSRIRIGEKDRPPGNCALIGLTSDGFYFYAVNAQLSGLNGGEENSKLPFDIYLSVYEIAKSSDGGYDAKLHKPHLLLQRDMDVEPPPEAETSKRPRISYVTATVGPPQVPPRAPPDPLGDRMTSLGIRLRDLNSASYVSNGNYLTIFTEYLPGVSSSAQSLPSPLIQSLNRHFGTATTSALQNPKLVGSQIHVCLHGGRPVYTKHSYSGLPPHCSFHRGPHSVVQVGFAYDALNNLIWNASGEYVDAWKNSGRVPPWKERKGLMAQEFQPTDPNVEDSTISVDKVLNLLWSHVGLQASHFVNGSSGVCDGHSVCFCQTWEIMRGMNWNTLDATELTSYFLVLQATIQRTTVPLEGTDKEGIQKVQSMMFSLFADSEFIQKFPCDPNSGLYYEASRLLTKTFEHLCHTDEERQKFMNQIFQLIENEQMDTKVSHTLKTQFLHHLTKHLEQDGILYLEGQRWILSVWILRKIVDDAVQHTWNVFDNNSTEREEIIPVPLVDHGTAYIAAVVNCLLKTWILSPALNIPEDPIFSSFALEVFKTVLNHCSTIVDRAIEFAMAETVERSQFITTENILKASLVGLVLPQIYMWLCEHSSNHCDRAHPSGHSCPVAEEVAEECVQLCVAISHLLDRITPSPEPGRNVGSDWSSNVEKLYPFQNHRFYESSHPLKDSFKSRETLVFTGSRRLYLKMDPKSATQYDYDKLIINAGTGSSAKRVAEYGGNFYGFGNKNVSASYWARDIVKIDSDTLTYSVEIQSGKEHQTPPEAVWGYAFTVFPVYDSYTSRGALVNPLTRIQTTEHGVEIRQNFFIDKLSLASMDGMSCVLSKLINGEPITSLETEMPSLFANEIISKFKWPKANRVWEKDIFLRRISNVVVSNFRQLGKCGTLPQMRNTLKELIQPDELEKLYVLACFKCLTNMKDNDADEINPDVLLAEAEGSNLDFKTNPTVLHQIFQQVDAFIRKLISIADVQSRLKEEVGEVIAGKRKVNDIFAFDLNAPDAKSDLENLAFICDLNFDKDNLSNTVTDLKSIIEAFVLEGSCPELSKLDELLVETVIKLRFVLSAEKTGSVEFWQCDRVEKASRRIRHLHRFVFSHLRNSKATMNAILEVIESHRVRACSRSQGLQLILKLLECSKHNSQSILMTSFLLYQSKQMESISCSGLNEEINDLTGRAVKAVVEKARESPLLHRYSIALLCIIPYKREDENPLVESKLLELLDELCALQTQALDVTVCKTMEQRAASGSNTTAAIKNTTSLAWAAFQVLAHCCSSWEAEKKWTGALEWVEPEHVALPLQISRNITNHLARATAIAQLSFVPSENPEGVPPVRACGSVLAEGVQDVLGLLDILRSTKLGRKILRQSSCVCRLLALLLDPRQPPFIVLTIIRLLGTALPLVESIEAGDLHQMNIPLNKKKGTQGSNVSELKPHSVVVSLLLSKLADFMVVCGNQQAPNQSPTKIEEPKEEGVTITNPNQLNSSRRSRIPPAVITVGQQGSASVAKAKVVVSEQKCKEKNVYLQAHDPTRTFLSGDVAAGLAVEVTKLIRQLLNGSTDHLNLNSKSSGDLSDSSGQVSLKSSSSERLVVRQKLWTIAVEQVIISSLKNLSKLSGHVNPLTVSLDAYVNSARTAIAALGVLGSLNETIKVGTEAWVLASDSFWSNNPESDEPGIEFWPTKVKIMSISERTGIAIVQYLKEQSGHRDIAPAKRLHVPISRLATTKSPSSSSALPDLSSPVIREIANSLKNLLIPHAGSSKHTAESTFPIRRLLPTLNQILSPGAVAQAGSPSTCSTSAASESRAIAQRMTVVRLIAEIRSRSAYVLASWLRNREFMEVFLGMGTETMNGWKMPSDSITAMSSLNGIAKECKASHRIRSVEGQVTRLRLLYRDCTKPPKVTLPSQGSDDSKTNPGPGTTSAGTSNSDSALRFRRITESLQDLEIQLDPLFPYLRGIESESDVSFVDTDSEDDEDMESDYVSPLSSRSDLPEDSEQLFEAFSIGVENDESETMLENEIEAQIPVVVISEEVQDHEISVTSPLTHGTNGPSDNAALKNGCAESSRQTRVAKPKPENKDYVPATVLEYYLSPSTTYDVRIFSGPNPYTCPCSAKLETESEFSYLEDDGSSDKGSDRPPPGKPEVPTIEVTEDIHELLVKAWETKVFPIIRRRFRNESERRDGLEQIRNALTLGMIDIARQTVEFLYEENSGIPRDLHLPTLEEIKQEASRFTMERIKIGMHVIIHPQNQKTEVQDSVVPKYAVNSMLKTFGLIGEVLEVDQANELILVESYAESDGTLQRFWYPLKSLERLAGEKKAPPNSRTMNMFKLHVNLVNLETSLTQFYCRKAFLRIRDFLTDTSYLPEFSQENKTLSSILEVDLRILQIRSEDAFSEFPLNGDLLTWNLAYGAPPVKFLTGIGGHSVVFYKECEKLTMELKRSIEQTYHRTGAEGLVELTSQICNVLEIAHEKFMFDDITLEKEGLVEVDLPDMAFTLVSVQGPLPKKGPSNLSVLNKDPCIHILGKNGGDLRMYPLVCYPVQSLGALLKGTNSAYAGINPGPGIRDRKMTAFPPILVPAERIACSISEGTLPGHILQVVGIPAEFPLALLYCEHLIGFIQDQVADLVHVGINALSILFEFLLKTTMPPVIKEWILLLSSGFASVAATTIRLQEYKLAQSALINRLFTELVVLYDQEIKRQTGLIHTAGFVFSTNAPAGERATGNSGFSRGNNRPNRGRPFQFGQAHPLPAKPLRQIELSNSEKRSNVNDSHGFPLVSSYFQALLELCLNLSRRNSLSSSPAPLSPPSSAEPSGASTPARTSSTNAVMVMSVEMSSPRAVTATNLPTQKRAKVLKPTTPSSVKSNTWKRAGKGIPLSQKLPETTALPLKLDEFSLSDYSEISWFRQAAYAVSLLSTFGGHHELYDESFTVGNEVVQNCLVEMKPSTAHSRLLVLYGAPPNIPNMPVEASVARALKEVGGIYGNEIWVSEDGTDLVLELRTSARVDQAFETLRKNLTWYPVEDFLVYPSVTVSRVNSTLETGDRRADSVLAIYFRQKIFTAESPEKLTPKASEVFSTIFTNCYVVNYRDRQFDKSELEETDVLLLRKRHILNDMADDNLMRKFVETVKPANFELDYFVQEILKRFGQRKEVSSKSCSDESPKSIHQLPRIDSRRTFKDPAKVDECPPKSKVVIDDGLRLSESGFLEWCSQLGRDNLTGLWRGLFETGHDIRLDKCWVPEKTNLVNLMTQGTWTKVQDAALITYSNQLGSKLRISPQIIHPHEIYMEENLFLDPVFQPLQGIPLEYIRIRFAILQHFNQIMRYNLLPFVSLNVGQNHDASVASLLHDARYLLFHSTKDEFLYKVFQHSAHRGHEIAPPDVTLDPIRNIGIPTTDSVQTMFSSAVCQLSQIPSQMLCVVPATGSDPPLAMVVKFVGEEVQGIIGSFRHFLGNSVQEFQEPALGFFIPCPSSAAGRNKDSLVLRPGPITYGEERFLECLGQFFGICLRADSPIPMTLLTSTWRSLLNTSKELNDIEDDLKEADALTAAFLEAFELEGEDETAFKGILESQEINTFEYVSMDGTRRVPLCPGGHNLNLRYYSKSSKVFDSYVNKNQFVRLVRKLREKELMCTNRVSMILAGLSTILPMPLIFNTFTSSDLRLRVSGSPEINLPLLKAHTHYQVGISESDPHIQFFWTALESMTPQELRNFVKFATNQDRLPASCPCQNLSNSVHVPPFPMKLAPIDMSPNASAAYINKRTIRAETCLFLIRLPPYTTYQVTRDQLLYACNSRDDPLSG